MTIESADMLKIRASIEVYDFADGREVDRRPAYPIDYCTWATIEIGYLARAMMIPAFDSIARASARATADLKLKQASARLDSRATCA